MMPGPVKCEVSCTCGHHPDGMLSPAEYAQIRRDRERERSRSRPYDAAKHRRAWLKHIHGITPERYAAMLDEQEGRCCYCERPLPGDPRKVHVDHDHSCTCGPKKSCAQCQRGLACEGCNRGVGILGDDPDRIERVAANLRRLKTQAAERINGKPSQGELIAIESLLRLDSGGLVSPL